MTLISLIQSSLIIEMEETKMKDSKTTCEKNHRWDDEKKN